MDYRKRETFLAIWITASAVCIESAVRYVRLGESVILHCPFNGLDPVVTWRRDKNVYSVSNVVNIHLPEYERIAVVGDHSIGEYNLQITDVDEDDVGFYSCVSRNKHEVIDFNVQVLIIDHPDVTILAVPNVAVYVGENLTLVCAINNPVDIHNLTWRKNGDILNYKRTVFHIIKADVNDSGIYNCSATNKNGKDSFELRIQVNEVVNITTDNEEKDVSSTTVFVNITTGNEQKDVSSTTVTYNNTILYSNEFVDITTNDEMSPITDWPSLTYNCSQFKDNNKMNMLHVLPWYITAFIFFCTVIACGIGSLHKRRNKRTATIATQMVTVNDHHTDNLEQGPNYYEMVYDDDHVVFPDHSVHQITSTVTSDESTFTSYESDAESLINVIPNISSNCDYLTPCTVITYTETNQHEYTSVYKTHENKSTNYTSDDNKRIKYSASI